MDEGFARRDYYRVLQVDPSAHPEIVRAAYRTLLRVLGKHPDLGGTEDEARTIVEAYVTLGNQERRRAYDLWLKAHSVPPPSTFTLPAGLARWLHGVLAEYHEAPKAPFASRFDLVLEAPAPSSDRLYVKGFPLLTREHWPTVFTLCRAVAVARSGLLPSADVVLIVPSRVQDLKAFLEESVHHAAQWSWNRCLIAVCTPEPIKLHMPRIVLMPSLLKRLESAS